jgi:hypothetical protein
MWNSHHKRESLRTVGNISLRESAGCWRISILAAALVLSSAPLLQSQDDIENSTPTAWWIYTGQSVTDINNTINSLQARIINIKADTFSNTYTVTYVWNAGAYSKEWWWYVGIDAATLAQVLQTNNARLISLQAYDVGGGNIRFAVAMIANAGADAKAWWYYYGASANDIPTLTHQNNARLTALESYSSNGQTLYAFIMIANTGTDAKGWWWYFNQAPQDIGSEISVNNARLLDVTYAGNGNFNAVMESCANGCPGWWWSYGYDISGILDKAQGYGARVVTADRYDCGGPSPCFVATMIDNSQHGVVLPQLAFGGGWYTAMYFTNTSNLQAASVPVDLIGDNGAPLPVPGLESPWDYGGPTVNLAAQGSAILEAQDIGSLAQGYASLLLPDNVAGYGVFRQRVNGRDDQEAVVPLSKITDTTSTLIWDDRTHTTAVALVNPSASPVTVNITVRDNSGAVLGTTSIPLGASAKTESVLRDLPGLSGMAGKMGQADFTVSSGNVAVLGLRFGGSAFTSIPLSSQDRSTGVGTTSYVLPQLAFGGGWYTAVYFTNTSNQAASVPVNFIGDDGDPLSVPGVGTSTTVNLAAQGSAILEALDTGPLTQGYISMLLPGNVAAYAVFRQRVRGRADQEAVVPLLKNSDTTNTLIWDDTSHTTAVAVVNPSATPVTVNITVRDNSGAVLGNSSIRLPAGAKTQGVLRGLPGLSGMGGKMGQADFTVSSGNVAVLGLRFGGSAFTSIPATER